jgi:phage terminase small subunit
MRGRPPKPTKLHVIQGTGRAHRLRKRQGEPVPSGGIGDPPDWLQPGAKEVWGEIVAAFAGVEVLTAADRHHWRRIARCSTTGKGWLNPESATALLSWG